ncbi:hypothetical protein PS1_024755 [Malus domestica]
MAVPPKSQVPPAIFVFCQASWIIGSGTVGFTTHYTANCGGFFCGGDGCPDGGGKAIGGGRTGGLRTDLGGVGIVVGGCGLGPFCGGFGMGEEVGPDGGGFARGGFGGIGRDTEFGAGRGRCPGAGESNGGDEEGELASNGWNSIFGEANVKCKSK